MTTLEIGISFPTDFSAIDEDEGAVEYQYSLPILGCLPKHCRKRPVISGSGFMVTILFDTDMLLAYIEFMLCYHTWCHHSHQLPRELQEDYDLIECVKDGHAVLR
jgi:hypothetical protein